jgi:hypothetical protein
MKKWVREDRGSESLLVMVFNLWRMRNTVSKMKWWKVDSPFSDLRTSKLIEGA